MEAYSVVGIQWSYIQPHGHLFSFQVSFDKAKRFISVPADFVYICFGI